MALRLWPSLPGLALLALTGCHRSQQFQGVSNITGVTWGQPFILTDAAGHSFNTASLHGKVILLYFGYIRCTDVCVPTLRRLALMLPRLGTQARRVAVVFVSVDPHDTPARLYRFLHPLNPAFIGLTGTKTAVDKVVQEFHVADVRVAGADVKDRYAHSDGIYVLGPHGRVRLYAPATIRLRDLRHDVRLLL